MQKTFVKSRVLTPVLVLAAVVALALVLLFTLRGKADEPAGEIADFSYQTLSALDLANDADTDLRFLFTVGSLSYDEVGFVFSKTNQLPTVGGYGCGKKATTTVYNSIIANGTPDPAPDGRWWVAVKMTDIPHEYFDGELYVRPYVKDGEGVRYGNAASITVCSAAKHTHDSQLFPGCEVCELEDAKADVDFYNSSDKDSGNWNVSDTYKSIRGTGYFRPHSSNGNQGNDLLIEFSILWNESLTDGAGSALDIGVGDGSDIANVYLTGINAGKIVAKERTGTTYIYPTPAAITENPSLKTVSLGEYGWHRLGFRVHQEAAIVNEAVKYTYIITVYLDGEMVLKYDSSDWANTTPKALLFTATIENEELKYSNNDAGSSKANTTIVDFYAGSKTYLAIADEYMTCGKDFVQDVVRDDVPEAATLFLSGDDDLPAERWFELKGWKNETLLNSNSSDKPNNNKWQVRKTYKSICGNNTEKYYPDASNGNLGNDLLIEFSILWNESLADCAGSAIDIGVNNESDIANIYLTGVNAGKIVAKERTGTTYVFPTEPEDRHPNIGSNGWHRVGVRVHQEAAKVDASVQYTYIITIYLDGEMVLKYDSSAWATSTPGALLFTAEIVDGNLKYSPNDSNSNWASVTIVDFYAGSDTDLAIADLYMTCGKEFVQDVVKVVDPVARTTTLGGNDYSAKLWYQRQFLSGKTVLKSSDKSKGSWDERPTFATIQGEQHFYPDASNGNRGNDLLIEFSILWNNTMATVYGENSTFDIGVNNGSDIANIDLQTGTPGKFSAKERDGTTYLYPTDPEARHPNIGANGWHRVGVRVHQEAAIVADAVQYTYIITIYLDGEMILKYDSSAWATSTPGALLFTAEIVDGNLVYSDNGDTSAKANITIADYYKGSNNYLVIADEYMTCGKEFVRQVKPVAHPTATTDPSVTGVALPATTWYARTSGPIQAGNYTHTGFRSSDYLTVMSYNIEKYDGGWDGRDPAKAIQTILDASPDIAGLQEVNANWNGNLATLTSNGYDRVLVDPSTDNWPELFYKTERFTNLDSGYKRYSALKTTYSSTVPDNGADMNRDQQGRLFTWAMLEENATGKKILAISTHLHYRVGELDTASSEANTLVRQYEIRLMLAWIADQSDCDAVVVVGDMNEHYLNTKGKATTNIFRESGFGVARDVAAIKGDTGGTLTTDGRTNRPGYVFDLALIRGNVEVTYYTAADNKTDNAGTTYPSDHVPVVTEFRFR